MVYLHLICDRESLEDLGATLILALEKLTNLEMFIFFQSMLRKENQPFFPVCASAANISLKLKVQGPRQPGLSENSWITWPQYLMPTEGVAESSLSSGEKELWRSLDLLAETIGEKCP